MNGIDSSVTLIATLFIIIVAILWFFLPFAVFGTKDVLRELIVAVKDNKKLIEDLHETLKNKSI